MARQPITQETFTNKQAQHVFDVSGLIDEFYDLLAVLALTLNPLVAAP